jgi:hypothetical protein
MKINDPDSFNEKCDKVLRYLAEIATKETNVQILTHLNTLCSDMGINPNDPILRFLTRDKGFIYMPPNEALVQITSLGLAFISHSSFVQEQLKSETEGKLKWYETENAKQIFEDYPKIKARAKRSEGYAILALIVSAIAIVLPLICNKNG